jgi:hypothetical protein
MLLILGQPARQSDINAKPCEFVIAVAPIGKVPTLRVVTTRSEFRSSTFNAPLDI